MTKAKPERGSKEHIRYYLKGYLGTYRNGGAGAVIHDDGRIILQGTPLASYKYFEGVEEPIFTFVEMNIQDSLVFAKDRFAEPHFRFEVSRLGQLAIAVCGYHEVAIALVRKIIEAICRLQIGVKARIRIVCDDKSLLYVEFWEPKHAQACLDYLNKHYDPPVIDDGDESRRYPAYWQDKEVFYAVGETTYRVRVIPRVQVRTQGYVDVVDGRLTMFFFEEGGSQKFDLHNAGLSEKVKSKTA